MPSHREPSLLTEQDDAILTTREAASLLGVAISTAQQWIERGDVPSWKTPGGHRRVRLSAVRRLLGDQAAELRSPAKLDALTQMPADAEFQPTLAPTHPVPENEAARLQAVHSLDLVGRSDDPAFDRLTWLAAEIIDTPMALVTLLTAQRQWFLARHGMDMTETPREWAFCSHAILQDDLFVVEDALKDERFIDNPLVTGNPHIRFYAGIPLVDKLGFRLGTLCVLDSEMRRLREKEVRALRELAAIASDQFKRHESFLRSAGDRRQAA